MNFNIDSVTFSIPFSFPDPKGVREILTIKIREVIEPSVKFKKKFGEANLAFIIILKRETKELQIKGPTADTELVDFAIWLPYKKIKNSSNYKISYLEYIQKGMLQIFKKYDFDLDKIEHAFTSTKREISQE